MRRRRTARSRASRVRQARASVASARGIGERALDDGHIFVAVARDPVAEPERAKRLAVERDGGVAPGQVTTGTPCHEHLEGRRRAGERPRIERDVDGGGFAAKRIRRDARGTMRTRGAVRRTRRGCAPARCLRERRRRRGAPWGTAASRRDQSASVASVSFEPLLNEPSVGWPAASIGSGPALAAPWPADSSTIARARGGASVSLANASARARRVAHRVRDPVVDRVEPGRVQIVEPRDLHGRGLAAEHAEPVVPGVAGDVDQDVDAVVADPLRDRRVGGALHHARGDGAEAVQRRLRLRIVEIREHVEARPVVRAEHGLDERGQRGVAVGRDVADAQAAVRDPARWPAARSPRCQSDSNCAANARCSAKISSRRGAVDSFVAASRFENAGGMPGAARRAASYAANASSTRPCSLYRLPRLFRTSCASGSSCARRLERGDRAIDVARLLQARCRG